MMNRTLRPLLAGAALLAACAPNPAPTASVPPRQPATFPSDWRVAHERAPSVDPHAMIVSNSAQATDAGVEILKRGGNAVDAAVAVGFALEVTYPFAGNIGGGGFMVIRMADGRTAAIDYREVAPLAATRDMYVENGKLTDKSVTGALAVGVPGSVAGMSEALRKYGTMSLHDVMQPAIRLARDGFVVDSALHRSLLSYRSRITRYAGAKVFYPNGVALEPGTTFRQPELARTLTLIADQGPAAFYTGPIADQIVAEQQHDGGIITKEDLARYRPIERTPITGTYRGYTLYTMPPSSSGGITMLEILNQLETWKTLPSFNGAEYKHLLAETFQRAFVDRNTKLGDPAFVRVPLAQLTSKEYARSLAATIDPSRATPPPAFEVGVEPMHTTHYSVVDAQGDAVSTTTTLNNGYGSAAFVDGAGFFLNDEMDDFAAQPGKPNMFGLVQGEANAIQPGKRMLSAMSPTIVLDPQGKLFMVVGAAGGPTIITGVTQVILNVIDQHMTLQDAMRAPRMHQQAWPDTIEYERDGFTTTTTDSLVRMGHHLRTVRSLTDVNALMRDPSGGWVGVVEPRSTGEAAGY